MGNRHGSNVKFRLRLLPLVLSFVFVFCTHFLRYDRDDDDHNEWIDGK